MAKTSKITLNSTAFTAIIPLQSTAVVSLQEDLGNSNWPTTDFLVCRDLADTPRRISAGNEYPFECEGVWVKGYIAGYAKTVTGSADFIQDEKWT